MNIEEHEIRVIYYALKATKRQMEIELEKKRNVIPPSDFSRAEEELRSLNELFAKVEQRKNQIPVDLNPFTFFPNIFFSEITDTFDQ